MGTAPQGAPVGRRGGQEVQQQHPCCLIQPYEGPQPLTSPPLPRSKLPWRSERRGRCSCWTGLYCCYCREEENELCRQATEQEPLLWISSSPCLSRGHSYFRRWWRWRRRGRSWQRHSELFKLRYNQDAHVEEGQDHWGTQLQCLWDL